MKWVGRTHLGLFISVGLLRVKVQPKHLRIRIMELVGMPKGHLV